jgi:hypothetical protein
VILWWLEIRIEVGVKRIVFWSYVRVMWLEPGLCFVQASLSTRANQLWAAVPCITAGVVFLCSAIYVVCLLVGYDYFREVCLAPYFIVGRLQGAFSPTIYLIIIHRGDIMDVDALRLI